jgi:hypothetical protein
MGRLSSGWRLGGVLTRDDNDADEGLAVMQVRQTVGKLAEVVFRLPMSVEELSSFVSQVRGMVQAAPEPLAFVCDWRDVDRFDPTFADTIVWTMRRDNPRIAANGVLVAGRNDALFDQVEQVLREARKPERRVFRHRADLAAFLDPRLTREERRRRDQFLDDNDKAYASPVVGRV